MKALVVQLCKGVLCATLIFVTENAQASKCTSSLESLDPAYYVSCGHAQDELTIQPLKKIKLCSHTRAFANRYTDEPASIKISDGQEFFITKIILSKKKPEKRFDGKFNAYSIGIRSNPKGKAEAWVRGDVDVVIEECILVNF